MFCALILASDGPGHYVESVSCSFLLVVAVRHFLWGGSLSVSELVGSGTYVTDTLLDLFGLLLCLLRTLPLVSCPCLVGFNFTLVLDTCVRM